MPMDQPWRTAFVPGDYIFGYANVITEFALAHKDEGASDKDKIQELATDRAQALDGKGKDADKRSFLASLEKHPKYGGIVSDSDMDIRATSLAGLKPGPVKNNREWRIKSKGSLYWATMDVKKHVHFLLDGIDMKEVVDKTHTSGPVHGQDTPHGTDATAKTRTITHSELRWLYRNKVFPQVREHVQFWLAGVCCIPPWQLDSGLWAKYLPKNSVSTPGIMWELD
ncbi:hypothetical protein KZX46_12320 [Polymorphobacter sp. PAMC 29334]|uniref:hypothetical protein n=1 Tax=Polymorphobacter sp. PAMC 29334 TaxID=2862331 RepID=UPI001C74E6E4|nr:hypothetical protein [Polymorphobacter sp. PAMC 29334]QYE36627.1 hypothetical protein KZX46_12320 [Polymorphobacter sp. PAMC 29334]